MAGNKDFIEIIREIRGSAVPGQPITDGIWYELTIADTNGNPGVYGDILAKYGIVTESAGTFDQAVAILENLNVEVTTLPAGTQATSALVDGVWQIGIPRGTAGVDGENGFTPVVAMSYALGNLNYTVTVDGVQVTSATLLDLDALVDTRVNANVDVQTTLSAKQEVLDAVADAQAIADGLDADVANKIVELNDHTTAKIAELSSASEAEKLEISAHAEVEIAEYDANAVNKTQSYNANHTAKLETYNSNDALKLEQYNENHIERMENLDTQYAERILDMLNTNKILGMIDKFAASSPTQYATFIDTDNGNYAYYLNGLVMVEGTDYNVISSTMIELTSPIEYGDIVTQVDSRYIGEYLAHEGVLLQEMVGQPNGIAGLDGSGKVPAEQLPSYVDDVIEVPTKAALPAVGELSKIYVVVADETSGGDTSSYRWAGSTYAMISNSLTAADIKALYESVANKVLTSVNSLQFSGGTGTQGTMSWNADEETVDLITNGSTLQLGQEVVWHVRNNTASTIANGTLVMATGTLGASGRITIAPLISNGSIAPEFVLGVATEDIEAGSDGKVTHLGKVRGINTSAWAEDDILYPNPLVAGGLTNIRPVAPNLKAPVAIVISSGTNGTIAVRIEYIAELADTNGVELTALTVNDVLRYNGVIWVNEQIINDAEPSATAAYSSNKTQALHDLQAQSIANLATSQAEFSGTGNPIMVLTATEQTLPFTVNIPSTNTDVFDLNDAANTVTLKRNASYNFRTTTILDMGVVSNDRVITVTGRNVADNTVVYTRTATVNGNVGDLIELNTNQLLTVGKNGVPSAPLSLYFTVKADDVGVTLKSLNSHVTSSGVYDLPTITASTIVNTPAGNIASTTVQAAINELDTEKVAKSVVVTTAITSVTFNADGTITIVTP